jgi:hypothetical protein
MPKSGVSIRIFGDPIEKGECFEPTGLIPFPASTWRKALRGGIIQQVVTLIHLMCRELKTSDFPIHPIRIRLVVSHVFCPLSEGFF